MSYENILSNLNLYHRLYRDIIGEDANNNLDGSGYGTQQAKVANLYKVAKGSTSQTQFVTEASSDIAAAVSTINTTMTKNSSTSLLSSIMQASPSIGSTVNEIKDLNIITYLFTSNYQHDLYNRTSLSSSSSSSTTETNTFAREDSVYPTNYTPTSTTITYHTIFTYLSLSLLIISLLVNLYTFLTIYLGKNLKTRTNTLMQNIFIADLLFVLFRLLFDVQLKLLLSSSSSSSSSTTITTSRLTSASSIAGNIVAIDQTLWFGQLFCKTIPSLQIVTEFVIAITITIIAIDKGQSICTKYSCRITNVISIPLIIKLIWLTSFLAALPVMLYSRMVPLIDKNQWSSAVCKFDYSKMINKENGNGGSESGLIPLTITFIYFVLLYCGPMLLVAGCYAKIYIHLYHYRHRYSNVHDLQKRIRTSDRKTVRALAFVAVTFAICWLPFHMLQIFSQISLTGDARRQSRATLWPPIYLTIQLLIIVATILNPLLYLCWSKSIRERVHENILSLIRIPLKIFKKTSSKSTTTISPQLSQVSCTSGITTTLTSSSTTTTTTTTNTTTTTPTTTKKSRASRLLSCILRWRLKVHDTKLERENQLQNNQKKNSLQKLLPTYSRENSI